MDYINASACTQRHCVYEDTLARLAFELGKLYHLSYQGQPDEFTIYTHKLLVPNSLGQEHPLVELGSTL